MREGVWIPREQVIQCLRDSGWSFKRQTKRVEIYKRNGRTNRLTITKQKSLPENYVRAVLTQAEFPSEKIEAFLKESLKDSRH